VAPTEESIGNILEGRVAGVWAEELRRTWKELAPLVGRRKLSIDLSNTTYADEAGIGILRTIYTITAADLVTNTPWTKYLAEEITR
jgi:anti-anti-sigma regulatory factor